MGVFHFPPSVNASVCFLCFALFLCRPLFLKDNEYALQEYKSPLFFLPKKKNFLSLTKPGICQWHQFWFACFLQLGKKCTPKIRAMKTRIFWHLSPCGKDSFRMEIWSQFLFANFKVEFFFSPKKKGLRMFTDHKRNCNKEINMHDPFSCSTTRLHC